MTESYWCVTCWRCGPLGRDGRCGCGSDAVVSSERGRTRPEWVYAYQVKQFNSVFEPLYQ